MTHPDRDPSLVVLISGAGSNLQALIDAADRGELGGQISAVVSNRPDAYGIQRADIAGLTSEVVAPFPGEARDSYDARLADAVGAHNPDLVVLAGWMRLLTTVFLDRFTVINLHPALPGEYPGIHAIERAFDDARAGSRNHTGVMVHLVPDEGVDDGPVLATAVVPIEADDTLEALTERVHAAEHRLLVGTISAVCRQVAAGDPVRPVDIDDLTLSRIRSPLGGEIS